MRRGRRQSLSPTLFPFLAVLVCTLGTLILLLALVAENAGEAIAASTPDEVPQEALDDPAIQRIEMSRDIERRVREARWYTEQTVKLRDEQTTELERRRDELAHLEEQVRKIRDEFEMLSTEIEQARQSKGQLVQTQQTLDRLLDEIEAEQVSLANLQSELKTQTPRIVIVPHQGPNGTDRRPVYVECRADGVYLRPGDQRIALEDLEPHPGLPNALETALRTIRHHALSQYGDAVAPYPLLVVRPDGIRSYVTARAAMSQWDDQFGYELVPADVELAFPSSDAQLDQKVADVLQRAIDQRQLLASRVLAGGSGRGASGSPYRGPAAGGPGAASGDVDNSGRSRPAAELPVLSAAQMSRGDLSGAMAGRISSATGRGPQMPNSQSPSTESTSDIATQGATPSHGASRSPGLPSDTSPGTAQPSGIGPTEDTSAAAAVRDDNATLGAADSAGLAADGQIDANTAGDLATSNDTPQREGLPQPDGEPDLQGHGTQDVGDAAASSAEAAPPGTIAGGDGGSQAAPSTMPSEPMASEESGSPSTSVGAESPQPVKRQGRNWALPAPSGSGPTTEMLRTIRIECHQDRFVMLAEGGRGTPLTFSFRDGDLDRASLELATAVRDRTLRWGKSLPGARWQPVLDVAVVSGAEPRFHQLMQLLDGSGLIIQARGTR